ncbi:hypothetical protein C2G38_2275412 [Gigaspora rosea]|uniref:Uncharacterized protein n=1 Tax=Gigaspora rosea TaxID=44941 RepID=A0A397UDG8_9GLOM|nr:hypothetical protein C2G38_2275412 [Gigaspora rosea]
MNDKEILAIVHRTFDPEPAATDSEEDEVLPAPPVNLSEAINALQLLIQFQEQRESDDGFKPEELNILHKKMYHFEKLKNGAKKQTDLFHYFGDTENLFEFEIQGQNLKLLGFCGIANSNPPLNREISKWTEEMDFHHQEYLILLGIFPF